MDPLFSNPAFLPSQGVMAYSQPPMMAGLVGMNPPFTPMMANRPAAEAADEIGRMAQEGVQETLSDEVFSTYTHNDIIPGCQPHPGDIVEAGSLAALSLPPVWYDLASSLPQETITSGKLSGLQLEGILYACQRHQLILPNGQRAGFFIGDGAGVGKGRQISGIILDNFARGRTKHIWFSISSDLIVDACRDLQDIGCYIKVIEGCQQLDKETRVLGLPAGFKEGIVFSTYATLVSAVQRGGSVNGTKQSRLQQLVDWCGGENFDGCLIFDECHKAKNFVPGKEQASTKVAVAVTQVQRILPKARVVYCSATGVTDVKNMAFMERLGLWGEGAPFKDFDNFIESIQRKGLGVAEMLAMEMKTTGMYVSRGLSFKQAEFVTVEAQVTKEQMKMYDIAAHVWNEVRKALESAMFRTGCSNNRIWAQFWSAHQRFFKQLCMGMKVPCIIREAKAALEGGQCVVIGLQTTGEASLEQELSKKKDKLDEFLSLCREILIRFVDQYFPTAVEGAKEDEPKEDNWSVTAKDMLVNFAKQIELPNSPLDQIIDELGGPDIVAEMTGRRGRMVRRHGNAKPQYELRGMEADSTAIESLNVRERNLFMEGKKHVAIISDAASTGISLHADMRCANQRRRVHMTIELPWSADKAVQQLGRSHRSNQTSGPLYKLVTTDLGGERRFAAAVARRLQSLGALTKGDRRAASGADLSEFNFDTPYGRSALRALYQGICQGDIVRGVKFNDINNGKFDLPQFNTVMQECLYFMGLISEGKVGQIAKVLDKDNGDVGKFLNRILGLSVQRQNLIFNYFCEVMKVMIANARKEGRYNEGLLDIMAASVEMEKEPREVFKDVSKGNAVTKHIVLTVDRGMSWDQATVRLSNHSGKDDGFYVSRKDIFGRKLYLLATQKENSAHAFRIARPNTGLSSFEEERSDLLMRYAPLAVEEAEKPWRAQYEQSKDQCVHGPTCRNRAGCTVGTRCYRIHLLCGGIVTLMSVLENTMNRNAARLQLHKSEMNIRVVRAELNNGERVVGIRYPEILIPEVEKALKEDLLLQRIHHIQTTLSPGMSTNVDLTTQTAQKRSQARIEEASPVVPKCLAKALNPPVTIKTFFKAAVGKPKSTEPDDSNASCVGRNIMSSDENRCKKDSRRSTRRSSKDCTDPKNKVQEKESGSKKRSLEDAEDSGDNYCTIISSQPSSKKRTKQGSIFAAFAKKTDPGKFPVIKKPLQCPICNLTFDPQVSNTELNSHIDNCLIE
ncbi:uncharacterized protein LOC135479136 [Liolophura sinensis]|uniref:uncharacterized protein LOC135479136 n=1 Tax=Liolophura sinensis TaxID=3198878 RepID=UPI003158E98C